jgi:glycerate kinase
MKIVIAIDSFKGSLTSCDAADAIKRGIEKACGNVAEVIIKPLADGGEGTVEALVKGMGGEKRRCKVTGPLGKSVFCEYGYLSNTNTAIIEMAGAAGIDLVPKNSRNPLKTTTMGVGEVIREAVKSGVKNFIIGIGGSVTNDCGIGMLTALGYKFLDGSGKEVGYNGAALEGIVTIDNSGVIPELKHCNFQIACDVTNPLCGSHGASHIFAPQKGATPEMVDTLEKGCMHFADVVKTTYGFDYRDYKGAGAAGGLGFAFISFLRTSLKSGIKLILEEIKLEEDIKTADYVITGEGKLDAQTVMGKAPIGVAKLAKQYGAKVIAFSGALTEESRLCNTEGIDAFFSITNKAMSLEEAMTKSVAEENMELASEQVFRLIKMLE